MSKRYRNILLALLLVVVVAGGVFFAVNRTEVRTAVIMLVEGLVEVRIGKATDFVAALVDTLLETGDEMKTGEDGHSVLQMDDGTVVIIAPNSSCYVEEMEGTPEVPVTRIVLNAGEVFTVREQELPPDGSYQIETAVGTMSIRGSGMSAAYDPDTGEGEATCLTGTCAVQTGMEEQPLTGNEAIEVAQTGDVSDPEPLSEDQLKRWDTAIDKAQQAGVGGGFGELCRCEGDSPDRGDLVCKDGVEIPNYVGCGEFFEFDLSTSVHVVRGEVTVDVSYYGYTNIPGASAMRVERPDGTQVVAQLSGEGEGARQFDTGEPGEPVSGETYTFTLLDAAGEPIPDRVGTDVWVECPLEEAPGDLQAEVTPENDVEVSWNAISAAVQGYSVRLEEHPGPRYHIHIYDTYRGTSRVMPWEATDDDRFGLGELPDGDYDVTVEAGGRPSRGQGAECWIVDNDERLTFTKSGDTLTFHPQCRCEGDTLVCDDGTVTPGAPECGPLPPGGRAEICEWSGRGAGLCLFDPVKEEPTQILADAGFERWEGVAVSPDGKQIVFSATPAGEEGSRLYLVDVDGSGLVELPQLDNDIQPAWSPDGEWLAFHSSGNLAVMRPDGTDERLVQETSDQGPCYSDPQWSPDSQSILAPVWPSQGCGQDTYPRTVEFWIIPLEGDGEIASVASVTIEEGQECGWPFAFFSPDGTQVAYEDGACDAWLVNADGTGQPTALEGLPYEWSSRTFPQWYEKED